jgi:glycosyltransferase involved in cell wall biosynthesis
MGNGPRQPLVSVVLPTYNGEKFLRPAIVSVLNQTLRDFELIIIDDASTDSTPKILAEILADSKDERLVFLKNDRNLGIAGATNKGWAAARGEFVAMQDHDDISLPHRLQRQVDFLKSHPEIALIGSAATRIDDQGGTWDTVEEPQDDLNLKWELLFRCRFRHMTLMIRRNAMEEVGGYREDTSLRFATDYDMLSRAAKRHGVANLAEPLVLWRRHGSATSIEHGREQDRSAEEISFRNICAVSEMAAAGNGSGRELDPDGLRRLYLGLMAFTTTPPGQFPALPAEQVISGMKFLCETRENFYRVYRFSQPEVKKHRRNLDRVWGKHAVALAMRAPWDVGSRIEILFLGLACLRSAFFAARSFRGKP